MTEIPALETPKEPTPNQAKKSGSHVPTLVVVAILILLNIYVAHVYPPVLSLMKVKPESLLVDIHDGEAVPRPLLTLPGIGDIFLTNTFVATFLVLILLTIIALIVNRELKRNPGLKPVGFLLYAEVILDMMGGMVKNAIDPKWRDRIMPFYYTFFIYILFANVTKILPFFETFGLVVPISHGAIAEKWLPGFYALTNRAAGSGEQGYELISFFRGASTSLNFTLSLAIGSVILIQVFGVRANGWHYFSKFLPIDAIGHLFHWLRRELGPKIRYAAGEIRRGNFAQLGSAIAEELRNLPQFFITTFVGLLELISEIAKVLSFAFRLFGNMFAGSILLLFLGYMVPVFLTTFLQLYELVFGLIQALVFSMLTAIFMNMAVRHEHK